MNTAAIGRGLLMYMCGGGGLLNASMGRGGCDILTANG